MVHGSLQSTAAELSEGGRVKISKYCSNNAIFMEINHYFCKLELYNGVLCPKMKID